MNILCITHADFESPGVIVSWAQERGYCFSICRPYQGERIPSENSFDFLIVMGGPQSPLRIDEYPYLVDEIATIKKTISQNKKVLGFCLGAQLIGEALGSSTLKSPEKEVGVYPITLTQHGHEDPLLEGLGQSFPVIHWHNDMPGLTDSAIVLAHSEGCPHQIVSYLPGVYGFQCHLEITLEGIQDLMNAVPEDLAPSTFTQPSQELLKQDYPDINRRMVKILDRFVLLNTQEHEPVFVSSR